MVAARILRSSVIWALAAAGTRHVQAAILPQGRNGFSLDLSATSLQPHGVPQRAGEVGPPPATIVYRGDQRSPDVIRAYTENGISRPGFYPRGDPSRDETYKLCKHVTGFDSRYVSTSKDFGVAAKFAGLNGYVYQIAVPATFVEVAPSLGQSTFVDQQEVAAMGGIPLFLVKGHIQVTPDVLKQYNSLLGQRKVMQSFTLNPDFEPVSERFSGSRVRPELAGFESDHAALELTTSDKRFLDWLRQVQVSENWVSVTKPKETSGNTQSSKDVSSIPVPEEESEVEAIGAQDLAEFVPGKSVVDLVQAIKSDKPVSTGEWLSLGLSVLADAALMIPNPATPAVALFKAGRATYKARKIVNKGIRLLQKAGVKSPPQVKSLARTMTDTVKKADQVLDAVRVRPAGGRAEAGSSSLGDVIKAADKVRLPTNKRPSTQKEFDEVSAALANAPSTPTGIPSGPIGERIRQAVKSARVKPKAALLAERDEAASRVLEDLARFADIKKRGGRPPLDLLERLVAILESRFLQVPVKEWQVVDTHPTFLEVDPLLYSLSTQYEIVRIVPMPV